MSIRGIDKNSIGLGNVENYAIASQAEAEAGTVENKYMNPLRTAQAITTQISPISILGGNVGIGTTGPSGILHTQKLATDSDHILDVYSANNGHVPQIQFRRSLQNTVGFTTNSTGSLLGQFEFYGVNSGNTAFGRGATIRAIQSGVAGATYVPADILFFTSDGSSNQAERVRITSAGNVGIGTTLPTAVLHLKAGTATANTAPLKFTAGVTNTTPEAGTIEFDGSNFFISI